MSSGPTAAPSASREESCHVSQRLRSQIAQIISESELLSNRSATGSSLMQAEWTELITQCEDLLQVANDCERAGVDSRTITDNLRENLLPRCVGLVERFEKVQANDASNDDG